MQRRNPGFNEHAHGFRSFKDLLKAAEEAGLLKVEIHKKTGNVLVR
jgi:hypothetical protein